MKKVLLYLWQLPQNILGLIVIFVTQAKYMNKGYWVTTKGRFGVSFGKYIIFGQVVNDTSFKHELGHQKQSKILGPLYLILVGVPSFLWNTITHILWIFSTKKRTWLLLLIKIYYHMPWEYTADKLGGVKRNYEE